MRPRIGRDATQEIGSGKLYSVGAQVAMFPSCCWSPIYEYQHSTPVEVRSTRGVRVGQEFAFVFRSHEREDGVRCGVRSTRTEKELSI